jgi:hypothetical protein
LALIWHKPGQSFEVTRIKAGDAGLRASLGNCRLETGRSPTMAWERIRKGPEDRIGFGARRRWASSFGALASVSSTVSVCRRPVRPCYEPLGAAPGRGSLPTPRLPAADWYRLTRRRLVPISCSSLLLQQKRAPLGCVRQPIAPTPIRAAGEHEAQLTVTHPSQPNSPFALSTF